MRKIILVFIMLYFTNAIFSQTIPNKIMNKINESNLFSFNNEEAVKECKPLITIICESNEKFTRKTKNELSNSDLFSNKDDITYEDIKNAYKYDQLSHKSLWNRYITYEWKTGNQLEYSIMYSQETELPIHGAGIFVFYIFDKEYVYIIRISDYIVLDEPNAEYDTLNNIFFFKEGQKADTTKGLEQTQGYYCINKESVKLFYEKLRNNDKSLPTSAHKLQKGVAFLESVLNNY